MVATCLLNRYKSLVKLLDSIYKQTYGNIEVVIVVDENRLLYEKICGYKKDHDERRMLRVIFNPVNIGLSHDRNIGISGSTGDIVAFIDDDAFPGPYWISEIVDTFMENERCGAVVGDVEPLWENDGMKWFPRELYWILSCSYIMTPEDKREVERGFGVDMSFRRDLLVEAGLFNTRLGVTEKRWIGGEDTDMFLKLRDMGSVVMFNPKAKVYHQINARRIRLKSIIKRSYNGGYSVALLKKIRGYGLKNSTEDSYLKRLILEFYPRSIRSFIGSLSMVALKQMACVAVVIIFESLGYVQGLVTIRDNGKKEFDIIRAELDTNAL